MYDAGTSPVSFCLKTVSLQVLGGDGLLLWLLPVFLTNWDIILIELTIRSQERAIETR